MINKRDNTDRQGSYDGGSITYYTRCHLDRWDRQHRLTETETTAVKEKVDRLESNRSEYEENKGTTTSHYPLYLHDNGCNGSTPGVQRLYLVMDNAPIHQSKDIEFAIKQLWSVTTVAYTSPPYSPELNPIEQLCPKVKYAVKMNLLME
ncbi:hypothetical protein [Absidia glauca]|uniref:Tc1-like transposase DDE domain-containing protein n=1 Tax=Absidia glauca TaxID=4829 RepID=A0A163KC38_ABSGL|nr:hypothetical protein [Absidia glauca]